MNILLSPKMVFSSEHGWPEIEKSHPSITKVFASIVLPLSLIPPAMIFYAGTGYGDDFILGYSNKPWSLIAGIFFVAEMISFYCMGWFIKKAAKYRKIKIDNHDAYLLAAIAPVPLWLSALGLFYPSVMFNIVLAIIALACSCGLIYNGIIALRHMDENIKAQSITYSIISAGLLAWGLFMFIVIGL